MKIEYMIFGNMIELNRLCLITEHHEWRKTSKQTGTHKYLGVRFEIQLAKWKERIKRICETAGAILRKIRLRERALRYP